MFERLTQRRARSWSTPRATPAALATATSAASTCCSWPRRPTARSARSCAPWASPRRPSVRRKLEAAFGADALSLRPRRRRWCRSCDRGSGAIPFTPCAKRCLEGALREALALRHSQVGAEHVALAFTAIDRRHRSRRPPHHRRLDGAAAHRDSPPASRGGLKLVMVSNDSVIPPSHSGRRRRRPWPPGRSCVTS